MNNSKQKMMVTMRLREIFTYTSYQNAKLRALVISLLIINLFGFFSVNAQSVLMQHNDLKRTGWDSLETTLTQANVSGGTFGKIFQINVDDQIYSQPLIVNNVSIGGGTHNIVIITTVNNSVYAFDADDSSKAATPYWHVNLTFPGYRPVQNTDMWNSGSDGACGGQGGYQDFTGKFGIVGTPAIDTSGTGTIYVVARSVTGVIAGNSGSTGTYVQYLHALNLSNGTEKGNSPVSISASFTSPNIVTVNFDPRIQNQRPALLLSNGVVYICWASHCDWGPYHGWIIGYDASSLTQKYVYSNTPEGVMGGIWMSGQGPSVDSGGNIYLSTGNGTTGNILATVNPGTDPNYAGNRGSSLLKLTPNLTLTDFFTPYDFQYMNDQNLDYGVDGVLLIPNTNLSLSGSKESYIYLVNTGNMGHTAASDNPPDVLQVLDAGANFNGDNSLHGSPVYFEDDQSKEYVYSWAEAGLLKQFPFQRSTMLFDTLNEILGNTTLPDNGAMLSVSSNGAVAGTGILWASHAIDGGPDLPDLAGIVQAFDATNVSHELWNSNLTGQRDTLGSFAKFVPPTIANGKLYIATFSKNLKVYGLNAPPLNICPAPPLPLVWTSGDIGYLMFPGNVCYTTPNNGTYTITSSGADIYGNVDAFHSVFQVVSGNDVELTAHVVSIDNTGATEAKVGLMFRSNLDPGSPNIFIALNPLVNTGVFSFSDRLTQGGLTVGGYAGSGLPNGSWLKLTGISNVYTAYASTDGINWTQVGTPVTINLGTNIYAGLAYTTHDNTTSGVAVVDNVTVQGGTPLPVTLVNFTATNKNNLYSLLNWETSAEIDFDHFEIEHSAATSPFTTIGTVAGNHNTQTNQLYNFRDNSPADGNNYYRLKMVDKDGKTSYSKVVKVVFNLAIMTLYPNPATDKVYLKNNMLFTSNEQITVVMINPLGQQLLNKSINTNGLDLITVNFPSGIKSGVYYLKAINSKGQKQNWKIVIKD
jgi:Secretion system C-terminal sorting domain